MTATIHKANMRWRIAGAPGTPQSYCRRANGTEDQVVFQQGIAVNAINAAVHRNAAFVTLACRYGGPPTVRLWGYPYRSGDTDYFDAGLHMKRASYCGDASYFTQPETLLLVGDDHGTHTELTTVSAN